MFLDRSSEGERNTLPTISSLSSHNDHFRRSDPHMRGEDNSANRSLRAPLTKAESMYDDPMRRPSSALDHHRTPPAGLLPHPQREMEPIRKPPFPQSAQEAYGASANPPQYARSGPPPPPFHRDLERGSPVSDEGAWRSSHERPDPRFAPKDAYSPHMTSAPYAARDEARPAFGPHSSEDPHRPRMPAPPSNMRDDGPWRVASTSRDRADMHPDLLAHERAREEELRWREERGGRPIYPYDQGSGYPSMGLYSHDPRSAGRPLDPDLMDDGRRIRRRATSSLADDDAAAQRYPPRGARPYGSDAYSPPESRSHSTALTQANMRPGMLAGMEPPRPASTLGVMPTASTAASAAPVQPASTTNAVNANRRVTHLLSEQKRRESINTGFEDLRQAIPACRDGQDSKASILKRALDYIRELESVVKRQHRPSFENGAIGGGYSNRSPPDDKDDFRCFGRPSSDEERRGPNRQMTGSSSSSSEAGPGPRIGGLPSNAYGPGAANGYPPIHGGSHHLRGYPQYGPPHLPPVPHPSMNAARNMNGAPAKRWAEDSDEGQRSPSRRRVSDGEEGNVERSPVGANYVTAIAPPRSPLLRSPALEKPRDWDRLDNKSLVDSAVRV